MEKKRNIRINEMNLIDFSNRRIYLLLINLWWIWILPLMVKSRERALSNSKWFAEGRSWVSPLVLTILSFRLNDLESLTFNNIYIITPESLMNNHPYLYTFSYCCFRHRNQNKSRKKLSWYICEKWETFGSWNYGNLKCGIYVKRKTIGRFM